MKCVLSQTVFAGTAHIHHGRRLLADLDCNGWPQTGRNKALEAMRRGFAFHIAGDQHLATVVHYGIDNWRDAGFAFCVPSIVNYYPRIWRPLEKPVNPVKSPLEHTGDYLDGLGNRVTMHAYANPKKFVAKLDRVNSTASGHGIVRFNKKSRKIAIECWPRFVDVTEPTARQFPGWPVTVSQFDNDGRAPAAWLPALEFEGITDPVVQVIDDADGGILYTIRVQGNAFRPEVFKQGKYTIRVGEPPGQMQVLKGISSIPEGNAASRKISF
jgi:hypothetical protein